MDFIAASECFATVRKLKRRDLKTLQLLIPNQRAPNGDTSRRHRIRSMQPSYDAECRIPAIAPYPPISVYPCVYQSAVALRPNQHSCGLQPYFIKQVQNIE